eukprot:TRINITY_DN39928_c0_g1_i1.p2 TRINITY_DN39928_c0_g1~~TRINITY_DN39928_c0_g1_i1.p2  ORF type:complete len:497 (+),score=180.20 TRINITY_DN39928_c0_g1_i1:94-1491(+)
MPCTGHGHSHGHDMNPPSDVDSDDGDGDWPAEEEPELPPMAEAGDIQDITGDGGIMKECLVAGVSDNRPISGAKVAVHYVGTLASDGSQFDSSRDRDELFTFEIGRGQVIKGWDRGVATMRKGEKSILTCTAPYAYGDSGSPPKIPGGATLKFEVELFSWDSKTDVSKEQDRSVMKDVRKRGELGGATPEYETKCVIDISGPGFDKQDFQVTIGDEDVPPGLEVCLESMKKGEVCEVHVDRKHLGVGDWGAIEGDGKYNIVMKSFEREKARWNLEGEEKLEVIKSRKEAGNQLYKLKKLFRARRKYKLAADIAGDEYGISDEQKEQQRKLRVPCLTNLAAVELALKDFKGCVESCTKALEVEPSNVKALIRCAKAKNELDQWDAAKADLSRVLEIEPGNADAEKEMAKVKAKVRKQDAKDRQAYGNLFGKLAAMEKREKRAQKETEVAAAAADDADRAPAGTAEP